MSKGVFFATVTNDLNFDQRMHRVCTSLHSMGFDTILVGRKKRTSAPLSPKSFRQHRLRCFFQRGKLFYAEFAIRCFTHLMTNQWDAVYAVDLDTLPSALLAARLKGKPCFFDAHEWFSETPEVERRPWIRRFWKLVGQATAKHADAAFTVGPSLARELSREYGCSFEVVRNVPVGRSLPTTHEPSDPSRPILLYQGMLNEGRGLESVILALKTLPEASLWIAGEGDRSEQLRQLVSRERLDRQVQFLGLLHPEALYQVTMKATLGLNLLESRSKSYYYSLANKAFDYLQAGIPAIHMNFPEYEALNHPLPVAYLIADLQPKTIAACIRQLINQPDSYHQIRENCLKMAPSIRWEEEFKTIEKIIDNVLTKRG